MRKTKRQSKRQSKRLNRKNKTFKKHKKGGQWFKNIFGNFGEKEPDNLNFRNAIIEDDEGYKCFRENINQLDKEKIERDKDRIADLLFKERTVEYINSLNFSNNTKPLVNSVIDKEVISHKIKNQDNQDIIKHKT
jgi:hypothetical protein